MSNEGQKDNMVLQRAGMVAAPSRRLAVYMLACIAGSLLLDLFSTMAVLSYAGMTLLAYGATVLAVRERTRYAVLSVLVAAALGYWLQAPTGICCLVVGLIMVSMAWKAPRRLKAPSLVAAGIACGLAMFAVDMLAAYLEGTTLTGQLSAAVATATQEITAMGTVPAEVLTVIRKGLTTIASLWPSVYLIQGLFCVVLAKFACNIALRRHGEFTDEDGFTRFNLSIHSIVFLLAALACFAVSGADVAQADVIRVTGYNLLLCSAALYAAQGFAVCGFFMLQRKWHGVIRFILYMLLMQMELMFLVPTLIGIVDLWANFRRLPDDEGVKAREGSGAEGEK